jgi:hypothetical protein
MARRSTSISRLNQNKIGAAEGFPEQILLLEKRNYHRQNNNL